MTVLYQGINITQLYEIFTHHPNHTNMGVSLYSSSKMIHDLSAQLYKSTFPYNYTLLQNTSLLL